MLSAKAFLYLLQIYIYIHISHLCQEIIFFCVFFQNATCIKFTERRSKGKSCSVIFQSSDEHGVYSAEFWKPSVCSGRTAHALLGYRCTCWAQEANRTLCYKPGCQLKRGYVCMCFEQQRRQQTQRLMVLRSLGAGAAFFEVIPFWSFNYVMAISYQFITPYPELSTYLWMLELRVCPAPVV